MALSASKNRTVHRVPFRSVPDPGGVHDRPEFELTWSRTRPGCSRERVAAGLAGNSALIFRPRRPGIPAPEHPWSGTRRWNHKRSRDDMTWNPDMTFVLIGSLAIFLGGWCSKIEVIQVLGRAVLSTSPTKQTAAFEGQIEVIRRSGGASFRTSLHVALFFFSRRTPRVVSIDLGKRTVKPNCPPL